MITVDLLLKQQRETRVLVQSLYNQGAIGAMASVQLNALFAKQDAEQL